MLVEQVEDEAIRVSDSATGWVAQMNDSGELVVKAPEGVQMESGVWLLSPEQIEGMNQVFLRMSSEYFQWLENRQSKASTVEAK